MSPWTTRMFQTLSVATACAGFAAAPLHAEPLGDPGEWDEPGLQPGLASDLGSSLDLDLGLSWIPIEERAWSRADELSKKKKKKKKRYKWAGKKLEFVRYEKPLKFGQRDVILEVRAPGKRGTWARVKLEF